MPIYQISPQDVLFFRDARPMTADAGSGGHGAHWPAPSVFFDAIHAALYRAFPEIERDTQGQPLWEHEHRFGRSSRRDYQRPPAKRFGSLATAGPFPRVQTKDSLTWLFPCPADITTDETGQFPSLAPMKSPSPQTNLPEPWLHPLGSLVAPSKSEPKPWWSKKAIEAYLRNQPPLPAGLCASAELFASEWTTGIAIDPATQTTGQGEAQGKIYAAEYLRLNPGVSLGAVATLPLKNGGNAEGLPRLFDGDGHVLVFGGQQRACHVTCETNQTTLADRLPVSPAIQGNRVKWVLLSPAAFPAIASGEVNGKKISAHPGGWLPNWICPDTGQVLLKKGNTARQAGESREDWRKRINDPARHQPFDASLVAARIPKQIVLSGWSDYLHLDDADESKRGQGAKPTLLAVPAGAAYYFEGKDAALLADALSWHGSEQENPRRAKVVNRRSTLLGEKGYGLGVCGTWDFYENAANPRNP